MSRSSYLMENPAEASRLEAKTDPAVTERLLSWAGVAAGMRALDAGAGTGAVARVMSPSLRIEFRIIFLLVVSGWF